MELVSNTIALVTFFASVYGAYMAIKHNKGM